ncbi:hypothetical protein [Geodermatophilus sp. FMUSA9-8]|uniref:hypothetical protein n=1 Tax=Geodermatophilus sp. FMUSA9-8 TaxID=3120155 RepID=UPI00300BB60C
MKLLGLAGLAGVAATGAVLVRGERQRRAHTPDEVRTRLHERHAAAAAVDPEPGDGPDDGPPGPVPVPARRRWAARLRRRPGV